MKKWLFALLVLGGMATGMAYAEVPKGWFVAGSAPTEFDVGAEAASQGTGRDAFIRAKSQSSGFATLMQTIDASAYRGKRVRLSGNLRTKDAGKGQLWLRIDGSDRKPLGFDNMEQRAVKGDSAWQNFAIVLDVPAEARDASLYLAGRRTGAWVFKRDFSLGARLALADAVKRIALPALRALVTVDQHDHQLHVRGCPLCQPGSPSGGRFFTGFIEGLLAESMDAQAVFVRETSCHSQGAAVCVFEISH